MKGKVFTSWSLIWLVVAALFVVGAALNLSQRAFHQLPPTDGVLWIEKADGIYAERVMADMAAARAGISRGDKLLSISLDGETYDEVVSTADIPMYLDAAGVGGSLSYYYQKPAYSFTNNFYYADLKNIDTLPRWTAPMIFLTIVGVVWFGVGIFVLFKQGSRSPFVLHFATVCLAAFVFHVYRPLNLGQDLDLAIQLLDDAAFAFFVPLFLHFCIRYPVQSDVFNKQRWKTLGLYLPAALITFTIYVLTLGQLIPAQEAAAYLRNFTAAYGAFPILNQVLLVHFVAGVTIGAGVLVWRFLSNKQPIVRQRLKWALFGTIAAVVPILGVQIARRFVYLPGDDIFTAALTTLPLALIPLSFGHSVVRYRLMDVDVVVKRALVYAMTTVAIAMLIGVVALVLVLILGVDASLSTTEKVLRALIAIIAMAAIVMLGEPLKNFLQDRANRFFYGERYDLRQGLLDFGRTLSATTALDPLLDGLIDRLKQVLDVEKVAVFIEDPLAFGGFRNARSLGLSDEFNIPGDFRQMIRQKSAEKGVVRADELETIEAEN